jgi:hypothetical protein
MKVTLDLTKLLQDGAITAEEADCHSGGFCAHASA